MPERRGITIHFMDGTKMKLDFPKQVEKPSALKLKEILSARHLVAETEGVLLVFPFDNIKYIEAFPAPAALPDFAIHGASIASER